MTMAELVVSNIRYLAKVNKIKLGEIEKQCGVSVGYFSRKVSMDGASIPIHVAKQAAEIFDVSLDELCTNFRYDRLKQEAEELGFCLVPIEPCVEEGEPDDIASTVFK